jgi:hypothetical protein
MPSLGQARAAGQRDSLVWTRGGTFLLRKLSLGGADQKDWGGGVEEGWREREGGERETERERERGVGVLER